MAVGVIKWLEIIDIDQSKSHRIASGRHGFTQIKQFPTIINIGQRINKGRFFQLTNQIFFQIQEGLYLTDNGADL